ncbi:MAG: hypothetical protein A3A02_03175 [Candidatus Buchananbacteria bacterium RIFCSPLOWO2_01_FULL_39_33]|uniref:Glycosyl transferase family 28 C-terminal domain-containing protein n=1 Tax=Candidatus Buchananbacteria bacterium RIFCSPLOWO2_01_FULL_39_33 TaxID=1797543 RepID=A0A1G1YNK5_9BACT|nr:MAG: hypothetical protein A2820_00590 [Candidatus Buchananbacteria bacterium RIFCSPHIGHO2_01_FULL_40_35]OGY53230.1 MAG: hypothetical protein A3A02_03175 [Candidatus Buchananbacteria bacterium RIFCSPLOWO2_01_FULL_39_33]
MVSKNIKKSKAWVVTVDMGYGHQRAAYPLHHLAEGGIITANNYQGIPKKDKDIWEHSKDFYEFVSRFKKVPFLGDKLFNIYDKFQSIPNFYPRRDLSKPNLQIQQIYRLFEESNWGCDLIERLAQKPLPLVTTFFITAFMAEYFKYEGEIYCIATDTDVSRTWVPLQPAASKVMYFAPNRRVIDRLILYGVKPEKIFLTGFPLPLENIGANLKIIKADLGKRLINLDPEMFYISQYEKTIREHLGDNFIKKKIRPLTITFVVGGAGAQRELGGIIIDSLKKKIASGEIIVNLMAGTHLVVNQYFKDQIKRVGLGSHLGKTVNVLFDRNKYDSFKRFNQVLRKTDILWTKPSELSFYCALGIPIITAPPIGSQEDFNQRWLRTIGAGIKADDPRYVNEWLIDWLKSGWLAEAAMQGFLEAPKFGTYNIEKIIAHRYAEATEFKTVLQY